MTLQLLCKSTAKRICEQKLESSLIKSLSEKNDKIASVRYWMSVLHVAQLDHAVIVQFSGVAQSRYLNIALTLRRRYTL